MDKDMTREEAKEFLIFISNMLGNTGIEYLTEKDGEKMRNAIESLEQESQSKSEDIAKAFQMGLAIGFGERHDELDRVIDEIKKVINKRNKELENQLNASVQNVIDRESEEKDDKKKM